MLPHQTDPIVAIATAPGRGAVGIIRVSGPNLAPVVQALCARSLKPREATFLPFLDADGAAIDQGLALHFPAPHSFTGEDVLELQAHGGTVVLQLLLARCLQAGQALGLRLAQRQFGRRAALIGGAGDVVGLLLVGQRLPRQVDQLLVGSDGEPSDEIIAQLGVAGLRAAAECGLTPARLGL
mgnify:CR=1 FL=1